MKQIVVISGKGGTGKTVITASFAAIAGNAVMADCDVDAADLHLLLSPDIKQRHLFKSGRTAVIDEGLCTGCGKCSDICRFEAISEGPLVDPIACEGCGFCFFACREGAIRMEENTTGEWFISDTRFGPMVHAKLGIAEENSGKLVSLVRERARELAEAKGADYVIIDGSPGIGCPVIASISGVDLALIVTEPTFCGLHDADRVAQVAGHFGVPVKMLINKYDLNPEVADMTEEYCARHKIDLVGRVPFERDVVDSVVKGKTVVEYSHGKAAKEIREVWRRLEGTL